MRSEGAYQQLLAPLATSRSGLMMLYSGDLGGLTDSQREYVKQLQLINQQLIDVVMEWAEIDRIHQGRVRLVIEPCNVGQIIKRLALKNFMVARQSHWPMVLADEQRLKQLIQIVTNVTKEGTIRARKVADDCVLTVETSSVIGQQTRNRWVTSLQGLPRGEGLGLGVARLLAELHGGSLRLDPHAKGSAKFHVRLPLARQMSLLGEEAA